MRDVAMSAAARVVYVSERPEVHRRLALEAAPDGVEVTMVASPTRNALLDTLRAVDPAVLVSERTGVVDDAVLDAAPSLRLVQRLGRRLHDVDLAAAERRGIAVCCWPLPQTVLVAEHAMALTLALAKRLRDSMEVMVGDGDWGEPRRCDADTFAINWSKRTGITGLAGSTVGIVAMGEIGTELAGRLRAFGCDVVYHNRRQLPAEEERRLGVRYAALDALLAASDVVVLLVPHAPETVGMTDPVFCAAMRPGALLVSCGASTTLDEEAVAEAYRSGHLGGVATDGHRWEPVRPADPLVTLARDPAANVVLTPHSAQADLVLGPELRIPEWRNIVHLAAGEPLEHRVV